MSGFVFLFFRGEKVFAFCCPSPPPPPPPFSFPPKKRMPSCFLLRHARPPLPFQSTHPPLTTLLPPFPPQTTAGFGRGVQNVLAFAKEAFVKIKDPAQTAATIAKMAADPNPEIQALFRRAQAGDKEAVLGLQDVFNDLHFPGVDVRVLREVSENHTFDKLLGMPELMRFIDRDETLSRLFRSDIKETFFNKGLLNGEDSPFAKSFAAGAGANAAAPGEDAAGVEAVGAEAAP